jgi:hypothetical protein
MVDFAKNLPIRGNVMSGMDQISDMPRCRVIQTGAQSFATATVTAIVFDNPNSVTIGFDVEGLYVPANSRTQIVCRTAGLYDVKANIAWAASGAGTTRDAWIHKNGSAATRYGTDHRPQDATGTQYCNIATSMALNAGDYLELIGNQGSGGPLSTTTDGDLHPCAEIILCLIST